MDFSGGFTSRSVSIDALTMDEAIDVTESEISGLLEARGFRWEDVFGIGFAITGFLVEGTRFNAPEPLSEWSAVHLGPLLADRFEKPVWTENGANTSALCERMLGWDEASTTSCTCRSITASVAGSSSTANSPAAASETPAS